MGNIISLIPDGRLDTFLRDEREKVTRYIIGKYKLRKDEAEDCFMEGSIALWRNIDEGKLTEENLSGSLSTYLMRCCCNHATHTLAKKKKIVVDDRLFNQPKYISEESQTFDPSKPVSNEFADYRDEQIAILENIVRQLPEPCYTILWNVYFNYHEVEQECRDRETVMDVIALMLGKSKSVLKTTKSRCMQKVKDKVKSMLLNV